jgi:Cellulose-binding Sde182, nucleoside hydrolase-like domain
VIDPYVEKQRVVVMTDIANEPDDQMSMVRFLIYSNMRAAAASAGFPCPGCAWVDQVASDATANTAAASVRWAEIMTRDHTLASSTHLRHSRFGVIVAFDP